MSESGFIPLGRVNYVYLYNYCFNTFMNRISGIFTYLNVLLLLFYVFWFSEQYVSELTEEKLKKGEKVSNKDTFSPFLL